MKKLISLGAMALLASTGAMATTVNVTPSLASSAGSPLASGTSFYVVLSAVDMPEQGGASLRVTFDSTKVTFNGIQLCSAGNCPAPAGSGVATPFDYLSGIVTSGTGSRDFTFALNSGTVAAGSSFDAVRINFTAANAGPAADAGITVVDDGNANCWGDPNNFVCYTGFAYNQAHVIVGAPAVPVPAAAWLFGSALGLLGVSRRRSA